MVTLERRVCHVEGEITSYNWLYGGSFHDTHSCVKLSRRVERNSGIVRAKLFDLRLIVSFLYFTTPLIDPMEFYKMADFCYAEFCVFLTTFNAVYYD